MKTLLLLFLMTLYMSAASAADLPTLNLNTFAQLPVQHDGRIMPLDSFARRYFNEFHGMGTSTQAADAWLAELLFDPAQAYTQPTFKITNADARAALTLPNTTAHLYSFQDISIAMSAHHDMMKSLLDANAKAITNPAQQEIVKLYSNMLLYFEISRSLSLVLPDFIVPDPSLADHIGVVSQHPFSYLEMIRHKANYLEIARADLSRMGNTSPSATQNILLAIGYQLEKMETDKRTKIFKVVPPPWGTGDTWISPWDLLNGQGSPQTARLLSAWGDLATAYRQHDAHVWQISCNTVLTQTHTVAKSQFRRGALTAEYIYNLAHLFWISGFLYAVSLISFALLSIKRQSRFFYIPAIILAVGFILHTINLALRIYILARPPVGTLYESILFVGWVAVVGALILELRNRQGLGLLIGGMAGLALLMLAPLFGQPGDTLQPLVAVLNTNFWLATHVLAITTGYGCCLVTALLAHIYLLQKLQPVSGGSLPMVPTRAITGAALIALCFCTVGTILGGIWADQSWGRFWGWDPKENGALLIVLWLLFLLHGKLSGILNADNFIFGAAATLIVVALSWFGVNLLNVGLHSYGFTSGIALYLGLFVIAELIVLGVLKFFLQQRYRHKS